MCEYQLSSELCLFTCPVKVTLFWHSLQKWIFCKITTTTRETDLYIKDIKYHIAENSCSVTNIWITMIVLLKKFITCNMLKPNYYVSYFHPSMGHFNTNAFDFFFFLCFQYSYNLWLNIAVFSSEKTLFLLFRLSSDRSFTAVFFSNHSSVSYSLHLWSHNFLEIFLEITHFSSRSLCFLFFWKLLE